MGGIRTNILFPPFIALVTFCLAKADVQGQSMADALVLPIRKRTLNFYLRRLPAMLNPLNRE